MASLTNAPPSGISALRQQLTEEKEEEDRRRRAEEEERRKQEEQKRLEEMMQSKGGSGTAPTQSSQSGSALIGANGNRRGGGGGGGGRGKTQHVLESKRTTSGATAPVRSQFTMFASAEAMDANSPIDVITTTTGNTGLLWTQNKYNPTNETNPACSWRRIYDENGPMRNFMTSYKKEASKVPGVTSRLVSRGGVVRFVRNDGPHTVGVFLINAPVSRSPENVLYKDRIADIKNAYYSTDEGKKGSISLIAIIPPNTCMSMEDDVFYKRDDVSSGALLSTSGPNEALDKAAQQAWINVTKDDIERSIVNDCAHGAANYEDRVVYVRQNSILAKFIGGNLEHILRRLSMPAKQTLNVETWWINAVKAYPASVAQLLSPEEAQEVLAVHPIEGRYVDMAKTMAEEMINRLPFENIEEHQFFVARLCGNSWSDPPIGVTSTQDISDYKKTPHYIGIEVEMWFSIVTDLDHNTAKVGVTV